MLSNSNCYQEKICIYIEPYTHINIKDGNCLLYNTLDGQLLVYENSPSIAALLAQMMSPQNLNAIITEKNLLEENNLLKFLELAKNMQLLYWYDYTKEDSSHKKPVSIPAILNFHREREKMALDPERNLGIDIMKYLHKLNIYINCFQDDLSNTLFKEGYKQFLFPYSEKDYKELKFSDIQKMLEQIKTSVFCEITILGGNIFQYTELGELLECLTQLPLKKELGLFYKDITEENLERLKFLAGEKLKDVSFKVFVASPLEKNKLIRCIELIKQFIIQPMYEFVVQSEADADDLDEILNVIDPNEFQVKPFYNGNNYKFFQENIFIQKDDLSEPVVSKKDIYARSVMNTTTFGHITILSNGAVHSNPNEAPIGSIAQNVKQLILNEFTEGKGWFKLRKDLEPCAKCIYQQICPPVSHYEYVLGRNDLCWLHQDSERK